MASGSGWNLWLWLLGVVVRRYIDFLIYTTYPYSSCICSFFVGWSKPANKLYFWLQDVHVHVRTCPLCDTIPFKNNYYVFRRCTFRASTKTKVPRLTTEINILRIGSWEEIYI